MPTGLSQDVPLLAVRRGGRVERLHRGSLAAVDEDGRPSLERLAPDGP